MRAALKCLAIALLLLSITACGRSSGDYRSFVASHDAIRPGMTVRQLFEAGLADYLMQSGGKNVPGTTLPQNMPVSPACGSHVVDIHYGPGDWARRGGFSIRLACKTTPQSDRPLAPPRAFSTRSDFLAGLDQEAQWTRSMAFRVESPPLKIGGVYDSYDVVVDEQGKVRAVSAIRRSSP